jgi:type II secretory pathway pseudopilin PulG
MTKAMPAHHKQSDYVPTPKLSSLLLWLKRPQSKILSIKQREFQCRGFTLIETIIYIGLFSLIFTGIFVSIHPLFTGAARMTRNIAIEGESAFILAKIEYALSDTITAQEGTITTPTEGATSTTLVVEFDGAERFAFALDNSNSFCSAPLVCKMLTLSEDGAAAQPLNAGRVQIENFSVTHVAPTGGAPRYLDVSFTANGEAIGPVRYYLHF